MKKDYRTSTNHEQWPRLASTHLIILLFGLIGLLFDPGKLSFGPSKPSFGLSKLSFGRSKQQSFVKEKRLFLDLSQKKTPFTDLKTNDSTNCDRYSLAISKSHYPTLCHV